MAQKLDCATIFLKIRAFGFYANLDILVELNIKMSLLLFASVY